MPKNENKKFVKKLSEISCEHCLQTGTTKVLNNVPNATEIHTQCNACGRDRSYSVIKPIRNEDNKITDYWIDIRPTKVSIASGTGIVPIQTNKKPQKDTIYNPLTTRTKSKIKKVVSPSISEERVMNEEDTIMDYSQHKKYFDVLAYKLDIDGVPVDEPSVKGSKFNDEELWNTRFEDPIEDAAPEQPKTIMPKEERLRYRNKSKIMQSSTRVESGHIVLGQDYIPIGIFTESGKTDIQNNEKQNLLFSSLNKDSKIIKESGKSMYQEPGITQWCPKVKRAVSTYICGQYCIDGRRIPQTDKEFETYQDILIQGGNDNGYVFCGYKDWLKREVDSFYPGWVEDHIRKSGGEISKNITPYQQKMNLDPGQRRRLPKYPDDKLVEKRLEENGNHKYDTNEISVATNKKKIVSKAIKKDVSYIERYHKDVKIAKVLRKLISELKQNDIQNTEVKDKLNQLEILFNKAKNNVKLSKMAIKQKENNIIFEPRFNYDVKLSNISFDKEEEEFIKQSFNKKQIKTSQTEPNQETQENTTLDPSDLETFIANNSSLWEESNLDAQNIGNKIREFCLSQELEYDSDTLRSVVNNMLGDKFNPDEIVQYITQNASVRKHIVQKSKKYNPWAVANSKIDKDKEPKKWERLVHHIKDKNKNKSKTNKRKK